MAALAFATLASASAQAATYVFDLLSPTSTTSTSDYNCGSSSNGCGNSKTYSQTVGGSLLQLKATAWSIFTTPEPDVVTNAFLGSYTSSDPTKGGLGITNRGETSTSPDHSVDNSGTYIDFVMFQFDRAVDLDSFYVGWVNGSASDADATIRYGDLGIAWNASSTTLNNTLKDKPVTTLDALMVGSFPSNVAAPISIGWRNDVTPGTQLAKTWIISSSSATNSGTDYFKLKTLSITAYPPVPEPATWMMMIVGFGAIGGAMRRRRSLSGAAAARTCG